MPRPGERAFELVQVPGKVSWTLMIAVTLTAITFVTGHFAYMDLNQGVKNDPRPGMSNSGYMVEQTNVNAFCMVELCKTFNFFCVHFHIAETFLLQIYISLQSQRKQMLL